MEKWRDKLRAARRKTSVLGLLALALLIGVCRRLPDTITVSNTVDGRELPIYCVETQDKKVALSFDAAWGNDRY